ncbi:MAG: hypothetical protein QOJ69_1149 [Actinomycetota bacterium]|nr:hypothetical protein [Actinomycetota bacterium]
MPIGGKRLRGHDLPDPTDRSIGLLFMVGSALFGVGSFPIANRWDPRFDSAAYAVGAVFFTAAATLQFLQSLAPPRPAAAPRSDVAPRPDVAAPAGAPELPRLRLVEQLACGIQLVGTLWFNVMTIDALVTNLTAREAERRIWYPDAFGSVCFLVASYLAMAAVSGSWRLRLRGPHDLEGRIAELNWWGSIAFGISALGGIILPSGQDLDYAVATVGTFVGAICFFLGARLMLPRVRRRSKLPA